MTQLDFQSLWAPELPDDQELACRYIRFNARYFDGKLPTATVRWSNRMRIAGTYDRRRRIITLSRAYHLYFPNDVDDTLKHEMIHLHLPHHDEAFRREAERIGASVHCNDYPGLHPRARYVYICPKCQTIFHRSKKERLFCGRCSRDRLDVRFMLVLRSGASETRATGSLAARKPADRRARSRLRRSKPEHSHRLL